jgi:hypothetical protein
LEQSQYLQGWQERYAPKRFINKKSSPCLFDEKMLPALGNDIAKGSFDFCLVSRTKVCLWRGQFANNQAGFKELLEGLKVRGFSSSRFTWP